MLVSHYLDLNYSEYLCYIYIHKNIVEFDILLIKSNFSRLIKSFLTGKIAKHNFMMLYSIIIFKRDINFIVILNVILL